jgi:hypothetical protein
MQNNLFHLGFFKNMRNPKAGGRQILIEGRDFLRPFSSSAALQPSPRLCDPSNIYPIKISFQRNHDKIYQILFEGGGRMEEVKGL